MGGVSRVCGAWGVLGVMRVISVLFFFFQAEDGIRDSPVTGVQTCALPISNLLLDYGVMFAKKRNDPPSYPLHVKPKDVDAAIITHAHLDHSGCIPALFNGGNTNVYCTPPTLDLSMLLIEDMLKIEKAKLSFDYSHLNKMLRNSKEIDRKSTRLNSSHC